MLKTCDDPRAFFFRRFFGGISYNPIIETLFYCFVATIGCFPIVFKSKIFGPTELINAISNSSTLSGWRLSYLRVWIFKNCQDDPEANYFLFGNQESLENFVRNKKRLTRKAFLDDLNGNFSWAVRYYYCNPFAQDQYY